MAVYQTERGPWIASAYESCLTGAYQTAKAARLAFRVCPQLLSDAWDAKRDQNGVIPDEDGFSEYEMRLLVAKTSKARLVGSQMAEGGGR